VQHRPLHPDPCGILATSVTWARAQHRQGWPTPGYLVPDEQSHSSTTLKRLGGAFATLTTSSPSSTTALEPPMASSSGVLALSPERGKAGEPWPSTGAGGATAEANSAGSGGARLAGGMAATATAGSSPWNLMGLMERLRFGSCCTPAGVPPAPAHTHDHTRTTTIGRHEVVLPQPVKGDPLGTIAPTWASLGGGRGRRRLDTRASWRWRGS
jgi:hypothetical protein